MAIHPEVRHSNLYLKLKFVFILKNTVHSLFIASFVSGILIGSSFDVFSQNGYVKINRDSIQVGYIKKYKDTSNALTGIEIWKTKRDKNPMRISMSDVYEYAIGRDTLRVLKDYPPYKGIIEARVIIRGKLNLLMLSPDLMKYDQVLTNKYILENSETQYIRTIPKRGDDFFEVLEDFIPHDFLNEYVALYGNKIWYDEIVRIVTLYNQNLLINSSSIKHLDIKAITFSEMKDLIENASLYIGKNEHTISIIDQLRKQFGAAESTTISERDEVNGQLFGYKLTCGFVSLLVSSKSSLIEAIFYTPYDFVTRKEVTNYLDSHYHGTGTFVKNGNEGQVAFKIVDFMDKYAVVIVADIP